MVPHIALKWDLDGSDWTGGPHYELDTNGTPDAMPQSRMHGYAWNHLRVVGACAALMCCTGGNAASENDGLDAGYVADAGRAADAMGGPDASEPWSRTQCIDEPVPVCSPSFPCINEQTMEEEISPSNIPSCSVDGDAKYFVNEDGIVRYYCHYNASAADAVERPLIIYLHGGSGNASNVYGSSDLRLKAESFELGDQGEIGFHLVSLQARNLHGERVGLAPNTHHDAFWWDFRAPSSNPDIRDLDTLIDVLVESYSVDSSRIYFIGWSEGAMLSQLYGFARHQTPSIYGYRVAAAAAYSGSSPIFWRFAHGEEYCSTELDFVSEFPIQITARSCDLACDQDQADYFSSLGRTVHALNLQRWEQVLTEELQNPNAEFITIDGLGNLSMCMPPGGGAAECNPQKAWANHLRWPKGREDSMLNFLRQHQSQ